MDGWMDIERPTVHQNITDGLPSIAFRGTEGRPSTVFSTQPMIVQYSADFVPGHLGNWTEEGPYRWLPLQTCRPPRPSGARCVQLTVTGGTRGRAGMPVNTAHYRGV